MSTDIRINLLVSIGAKQNKKNKLHIALRAVNGRELSSINESLRT